MAVTVRVPVVNAGIRVNPSLLGAQTSCAPPEADPNAPVNRTALGVAVALAAVATAVVWTSYGAVFGVYLLLGLALGAALLHSRFGFASAWQRLTRVGNGEGMRAQTVLLGTAASLVMLFAATGAGLFGAEPEAVARPLGVPLVLGAVLFGVGMQLAGSCASGTLFAVGSGQSTILPTLLAFIAGEVLCSWAYPLVERLPQGQGILLADHVGWFGSWAITIAALLAVAGATWVVQRRRNPPPTAPAPTTRGLARLYRGSWPILAGAVVLGLLAGLVFLVSGGVWGAANAFGLWGAKALQVVGLHPETWEFWRSGEQAEALRSPVLTDKTSLTNLGIMIGAAAAAAAAGLWRLHSRLSWRTTSAAVVGGLLLGIGTRLANGCNIGAFIGGISQGSVSGWVWGACALAGTYLGVRLRPLFRLYNPKPDDGIC